MPKLHLDDGCGKPLCGQAGWFILLAPPSVPSWEITCLKCLHKMGHCTLEAMPQSLHISKNKAKKLNKIISGSLTYTKSKENMNVTPYAEAIYDYADDKMSHTIDYDNESSTRLLKISMKIIERDMSEATKRVNSIFNIESRIKERETQRTMIRKLKIETEKRTPKRKRVGLGYACAKECSICKDRGLKYSGY